MTITSAEPNNETKKTHWTEQSVTNGATTKMPANNLTDGIPTTEPTNWTSRPDITEVTTTVEQLRTSASSSADIVTETTPATPNDNETEPTNYTSQPDLNETTTIVEQLGTRASTSTDNVTKRMTATPNNNDTEPTSWTSQPDFNETTDSNETTNGMEAKESTTSTAEVFDSTTANDDITGSTEEICDDEWDTTTAVPEDEQITTAKATTQISVYHVLKGESSPKDVSSDSDDRQSNATLHDHVSSCFQMQFCRNSLN